MYRRAKRELAGIHVALSATAWNHLPRGTLLKILPLTLPPFRGIIGNENGDYFHLGIVSVTRHLVHRWRQWTTEVAACIGHRSTAIVLREMRRLASHIQPITYALFHWLPKGKPASIELTSRTAGCGITRIEQQYDDWDRNRVAREIANSQSRFILFCQPGYAESVEDFFPLFADPLTFAVSRQSGYREWRAITVALSPFRPLAAKEVSRLAAPLGSAVLVESEKLLKLPLPDTLVFGTAWLDLFWRAGAAGWYSYSVGAGTSLPQQPAYFLDEMLFVKHLYLNRDMRSLASGDPKLCRGNIAFRPELARPYRGLPRLLLVAPYLPFPTSHGGAVRVYNLCQALAERMDLIYICFHELDEVVEYEELHKIFRRVYVIDRDEVHGAPELPQPVNQFESSSMRALVASVARQDAVDLLQIEWTDMAAYREAAPWLPAILVEHDVTCCLYRQYAEQDAWPGVQRDYEQWLNFETERLPVFDSVFVMSQQDQQEAIRAGANPDRTWIIPNGVDLNRVQALPPAPPDAPEIFFVGAFMHPPNLMAFDELRTHIMPRVWERFPRALLRVAAGADHEKHWRHFLRGSIPPVDPRIILHDFRPDLSSLYGTAHVVVVPLTAGAGTCIKVMEALASQRAVVTTPVGARGLGLESERDAAICELGDEFADAICDLLDNRAKRDELARSGRQTAEARFSWKRSATEASKVYATLMQKRHA